MAMRIRFIEIVDIERDISLMLEVMFTSDPNVIGNIVLCVVIEITFPGIDVSSLEPLEFETIG